MAGSCHASFQEDDDDDDDEEKAFMAEDIIDP
jgi:hypothetical protein